MPVYDTRRSIEKQIRRLCLTGRGWLRRRLGGGQQVLAGVIKAAGRGRIWNTFDANRLLCWAEAEGAAGQALALKKALFAAYQGRGENPSDPAVLLAAVAEAGLDRTAAAAVLESDRYAQAVREREAYWQGLGIHSVPAVVVNERHLISGGQPVAVFEQALRQIAAG